MTSAFGTEAIIRARAICIWRLRIALRNQRKELELEQEMAVLAAQGEQDERLSRAARCEPHPAR